MAKKKRLSPLQQMLSGQTSHVAKTPQVSSPIRSLVYRPSGGSSSSISSRSSSTPRGPAPAWKPSYFKPTPSLARTVQVLSRGIIQEENYDLSAHLGQILESRYDSYRDRMDQRFSNQRESYEHALSLEAIKADKGKDIEVPDAPKVPGLGRGQGQGGIDKALRKALRNVTDPDVAENISRFYRYEKERVQSMQNAIREQRNSIRSLTRDFKFDVEEDIARGTIKKNQVSGLYDDKPEKSKVIDLTEEYKRWNSDDEDQEVDEGKTSFLGIDVPDLGPMGAVSEALDKGLRAIGGEAKDPLFWTLDKLSRPLYGTMSGAKNFYAQDKDDPDGSDNFALDFLFDGGLAGKNPIDSLDEIASDPVGFAKSNFKAWGRGVSGKEKTTFRDVVAYNAAHDEVKDIRDASQYQAWVGLTGDLLYDPLNFVGVGVVKKPLDVVKGAKQASDIRKTSKGIADIVASSQHATSPAGHLAEPDNVYRLLTADASNRLPTSTQARRKNIFEINQNTDYLLDLVKTADINADTSKLVSIEAMGKALAERRQALVDEWGDHTLTQAARDGLEKSVQAGSVSPESIAEFDNLVDNLESDEIVNLLTPANERFWKLEDIAEKEFNAAPSWEYNGPDEAVGDATSVRTVVDNLDRWEGQHKNSSEQNIVYAGDDTGEILETVSRYDKKVEAAEKALKSFDASRYGKEAKASTPISGETKGYTKAQAMRRDLVRDLDAAKAERNKAKSRNRDKVAAGQSEISTERLNASAERRARGVGIQGTTRKGRGKKIRSAWENVANDSRFADRVSEILSEAGPDFKQSLPSRLKNDPRLDDFDWEQARRQAFSAVTKTDEINRAVRVSKVLTKDIKSKRKAIATARSQGNESLASRLESELHGYSTRRDVLNNRRDRAQAAYIIKLAKAHIAGKEGKRTFTNGDQAWEINSKLDQVNRALRDRADDQGLLAEKRELEASLKELEGVSPKGKAMSLQNAPEHFVKDGKLDTSVLAKVVQFDKNQKVFKIKKDYPNKKWLRSYQNVLQSEYERMFDSMRTSGLMRQLRDIPKDQRDKGYWKRYNAAVAETSRRAQAAAIKNTEEAFEAGRLHETVYSESLDLMLPKQPLDEAMVSEVKSKQAAETAMLREEKRIATVEGAQAEIDRLNAELGALRQKHTVERIAVETAVKRSREAKKVMEQRMKEEAIFRAASVAVSPYRKDLAIQFLGSGAFTLPGSGMMLSAGKKAAETLPLVKGTRQAFADAFKSPASQLTPEGQLIRARAIAMTPNIIEHHINKLRHTLGAIREQERNSTFVNMIDNGYAPKPGVDKNYDAIRAAFDDLLPYFRNEVPVGDGPLTKFEINRYLPEEYQININAKIGSTQDLIKSIRGNKGSSKYDRKLYKDPYRISWNMRVAIEQAQAKRALDYNINKSFGIKRGGTINPQTGKVIKGSAQKNEQYYRAVERFKDAGWQTIPELNHTHYFPPEAAGDIKALLHMMEPRNVARVGEVIDKATRGWKTATTIYNPGYWTRNGVGEIMSSWLAGVNDPRAYSRALDIMKFARGDGRELDELAKHIPDLNYKSKSIQGNKVLFKDKKGNGITVEQLWLAYNHHGLKTGFVNTEFDSNFSKLGTAIRDNRGTQKLANFNDKLRGAGEWYEDYLRMAHFADAIRRNPNDFATAAKSAAEEVRKYHFDYTDFTDFEKMTMLRAFPFYKWTRKAMPLMVTMLFTKPGKVMAYPKIMNTISTQDIARDDNGFAPNYEGIVPGWIQDMWAYKIAEGDNQEESYFNLATPQMDAYKSIVSPGSTAYGLLNPLAKVPVEQTQEFFGEGTLSGLMRKADFTNNTDMDIELNTNDERETPNRINQVLRQVPFGNILQKAGISEGTLGDASTEDWASFGTGLGLYENNDRRRMGELMNKPKKERTKSEKSWLKEYYANRK